MPNWCYTNIRIISDDHDALKSLNNLIGEWTSKNYIDNGFGLSWLGNIVGNSGIDIIKDGDFNIRCRGSLLDYECNDGMLCINTETAWGPMLKMWLMIIDKYIPGANLLYTADECGMELYYTNDEYYMDKYYVDQWDEVNGMWFDDDGMDTTHDRVVEILQSVLDTKENNIDILISMFNDSEYADYMAIREWEFVYPEDLN